ncbi:MAG: sigma-70 family RNA polymerase sigma factor [Planctomycetes bacterium]|nr:sigma-70 family RNA polymerase sigma factor [Planctomycetota bacterium]MCB9891617.1 sigma-70 family RNA polymerase sigma factor [Planctomycetota bacterium]MCB9917886.1 sigma-70 family RNA polymerase sigma factor [Planctomycetota bacterium]
MRTKLEQLFDRERAALLALVAREGGGLLRFESVDDVVQGIAMRALSSDFEYVDDVRAAAWLRVVARRHIVDRLDYWRALRRGSGRVLRLTWTDSSRATDALPADRNRGPATFAEHRELVELATKALNSLPERDRHLVLWSSEGIDLREQAERIGIEYGACQRAAHRARERFRKAFELLVTSQRRE